MSESYFDGAEFRELDRQFEEFKELFKKILDDLGVSAEEVLDSDELFALVTELLAENQPQVGFLEGLEADSLTLIELISSLEDDEDGGDGSAGDREPRNPQPQNDTDAMSLPV